MSALPVMQDNSGALERSNRVAVIVAETQEAADQGASLVRIDYQVERPALAFEALLPQAQMPKNILGQPRWCRLADAEAALKGCRDSRRPRGLSGRRATITTPSSCDASTAQWDGDDSFVVHDSSQVLGVERTTLATMFGLEQKKVRVLAPFGRRRIRPARPSGTTRSYASRRRSW